MILFRL